MRIYDRIQAIFGEEKALPKTEKCKYCKEQATKRVIWADGRAYVPVCGDHVQYCKDDLDKRNGKMAEIIGVRDIKAYEFESKDGVRRVRDPEFWGLPYGTAILPGMKPKAPDVKKPAKAPGNKPAAVKRPAQKAPARTTGKKVTTPTRANSGRDKQPTRARAAKLHDDAVANTTNDQRLRAWGPEDANQSFRRANVGSNDELIQYVSKDELEAVRAIATKRAKTLPPEPSKYDIADNKRLQAAGGVGSSSATDTLRGNIYAREKNSWAMYVNFGGYDEKTGKDKGYVPCVGCGVKMTWHGDRKKSRYPKFEQDKIVVGRYGGQYNPQNLVPMCSGCNNQRGPKLFHESPAFKAAKPKWFTKEWQAKADRMKPAKELRPNGGKGIYGRPEKIMPNSPMPVPPGKVPGGGRKFLGIVLRSKSLTPGEDQIDGTPESGDRVEANLFNFDGRHNDGDNIWPPDYDEVELQIIGTFVSEEVESIWGTYTRVSVIGDDGSIYFVELDTVRLIARNNHVSSVEQEKSATGHSGVYWTHGNKKSVSDLREDVHGTSEPEVMRGRKVPSQIQNGLAARMAEGESKEARGKHEEDQATSAGQSAGGQRTKSGSEAGEGVRGRARSLHFKTTDGHDSSGMSVVPSGNLGTDRLGSHHPNDRGRTGSDRERSADARILQSKERAQTYAAALETKLKGGSNGPATGASAALNSYWTSGKGLARWAGSAHPYTTLRAALISEGVPEHMASGLAAKYYKKVKGHWPGKNSKKLWGIDLELKGIRRVRTPEGVRRFKLPMGSIIIGNGEHLKNITLGDSPYAGFDQVTHTNGKTFFIGKYPNEEVFVVADANDNVLHEGKDLEDMFRWANNGGKTTVTVGRPKAKTKEVKTPALEKLTKMDGGKYFSRVSELMNGRATSIPLRHTNIITNESGPGKYTASFQFDGGMFSGDRTSPEFKTRLEAAEFMADKYVSLREKFSVKKAGKDKNGERYRNSRPRDYEGFDDYNEGIRGVDWWNDGDIADRDDESRVALALQDLREMSIVSSNAYGNYEVEVYDFDPAGIERVAQVLRTHENMYPGFSNLFDGIYFERSGFGRVPVAYNRTGKTQSGSEGAHQMGVLGLPEKYWGKRTAAAYWGGTEFTKTTNQDWPDSYFSADMKAYADKHNISIKEAGMVQVMTHEVGHSVGYIMWNYLSINRKNQSDQRYSPDPEAHVGSYFHDDLMAILDDFGMLGTDFPRTPKPGDYHETANASADRSPTELLLNKAAVRQHLSGYGATNFQEIMAETWAAYQLNDEPGDFVRELGGLMEDALNMWLEETAQARGE